MASTTPFLTAIENRRSIYDLAPTSPISDARILEIISHVVKWGPSAFNVQSCRCVVLLKDEHRKLWDVIKEVVDTTWPVEAHGFLHPKIAEFRNGYGTVLFYENPVAIKQIVDTRPSMKAIAHLFPQWSEHSNGMHQFAIWTAFEAEGLGCNLQHYEKMENRIAAEWKVPVEWQCKAQLVFGEPTAGPRREKDFLPLEERVFVHGA